MADSIPEKIVARAIELMKLIDGTGDYTTDIGERVKDSETNWHENQNDLPAISVFDGDAVVPKPDDFDKSETVFQVQRLLIRGFLKQGTTAAAARNLNADILAAIRTDSRFTVGGSPLVMLTRQVRHSVVRHPENFEVEACEVELEVLWKSQKFNARS